MSGHDDEGVDAKLFVVVTVVEAFGNDEAGFGGDENGEPVEDGEGEVVEANVVVKFVGFHIGLFL
ncbi:MAG: hypothetical protein IPL28_20670 [Chloroflexi bacterium]|nr:hypothetical protein [Chloroflexota bacterium]